MENSTSKNLIGYSKSPYISKLLNVIEYSINSFCNSLGFKSGFFSQFLPYSENQYPKYINPTDLTHNLKITDLELIFSNLDNSHKKIILDSLCQSNGFICVDSNETLLNGIFTNIETLLLAISATNGDLAGTFLSSIQDGNINDYEKEELNQIAYKLRAFLITFESRIKETN